MELLTLAPADISPYSGLSYDAARWRRRQRLVRLPVDALAAAAARRAVRRSTTLWDVPQLYETAELCVSELVTNAVRHVRWPDDPLWRYIGLSVGVEGPYFLVTVSDPDPRLPKVGASVDWESFRWTGDGGDPRETVERNKAPESGSGLFTVMRLVAELTGVFGFEASDDGPGKVVFFALPTADYSWIESGGGHG